MSWQAANAKEKIHIGDNKEHTASYMIILYMLFKSLGLVQILYIYFIIFLGNKENEINAFIQLG